jgi:ABC-type polysaccharide/polyol phosphate transport system ATPase subunit
MTNIAVQFEHVTKRYTIRHQKVGYLKDRLTESLSRLVGRSNAPDVSEIEDFYALRDVTFDVKQGESLGIVGPNGSGKSTTLKILAGVTHPTFGRVRVHGTLGALIEVGAGFHPELSGRENIFLNGSILGMRKHDIARRFDEIVAFAGVEKFIDTPVKHYSSGMYVRLGFSIAVHNEPDILLVDEVLAVGDMAFQQKCFDKVRELKRGGRTFVLISHSPSQIEMLCDRVIMLERGQIVAEGDPGKVLTRYMGQPERPAMQTLTDPAQTSVHIGNVRCLDREGDAVNDVDFGSELTFELECIAYKPVSNVFLALHIDRGETRIYDTDTRSLGLPLHSFSGTTKFRCRIPNIRLTPATYDVQAVIYSADARILSHVRLPQHFSVKFPPTESELGCGVMPDESKRPVLCAPAKWEECRTSKTERPRERVARA